MVIPAFRFKRGFTLVEFLVVIGLLTLAIGSTLAFLTSILKGSNQANVTSEVKQNGQAILDSLERQVRNASKAVPLAPLPSGASSGVNLTLSGLNALYIVCFSSIPTANGWIGIASVSAGTDPSTASYTPITNTNTVSGVDISDPASPPGCFLTVIPTSVGTESPDIVSVEFTVNQGISAPSRADFLANAHFRTTISLRRY